MLEIEHRYRVFISYNHRDVAWAEWLETKLEGYRIPRGLEGRSQVFETLPKRIKPVFRDRSTAAAGGNLPDRVREWLDGSESLIVICSPNSAAPNAETGAHWVNEEIEHFRATGKGHRVFALIVDGEPGAGDATEAFPPAFRDTQPAAADARGHADGKNLAFMKLAAGLLGVELTDLQDKQNREDQKRARTARRLAAGFAALAVIAGLGLWIAAANYWEAQKNRANTLAAFARQEADAGRYETAMLLALAGTDAGEGVMRPESANLNSQLGRALLNFMPEAVLAGHEAGVRRAKFSSDGTRVITASSDGTARLWDARTGESLAVLGKSSGAVVHAEFSRDGRRIVTASFDSITVWDAQSGNALFSHQNSTIHASFSADGRQIITVSRIDDNSPEGWSSDARVFDSQTGELKFTLITDQLVLYAEFSADGQRIVTAGGESAMVWDAHTGEAIADLVGHFDGVLSAAFSPDGRRVVTVSPDTTARVWDTETGDEVSIHRGHTDLVWSAAFSPDGSQIVTASSDNTARVWSAETGELRFALANLEGAGVYAAEFSPNGRKILMMSADAARIWDAQTGDELAMLGGHAGTLLHAEFSPDGHRILTASSDGIARLWGAQAIGPAAVLLGHTNSVRFAEFSPDGERIVTASWDGTARVWGAESGDLLTVLEGHRSLSHAEFSPDGHRIVTASNDNTARVWDAQTGNELAVLAGHISFILHAAFSPDGLRIVTASDDNTARVWDAQTGGSLAVLVGHTEAVNRAAFSPDGRHIVTASIDTTSRMWDAQAGVEIAVFEGHNSSVRSAEFSPQGHKILTVSWDRPNWGVRNTGEARVWDMSTRETVAVLGGDSSPVKQAAFSPDGRSIITSGVGYARIWSAQTVDTLLAFAGEIDSAVFSPDARTVITISVDNTTRLWDAQTGEALVALQGPSRGDYGQISLNYVDISPDGRRVVVASDDDIARVWDVSVRQLQGRAQVDAACDRLPARRRSLTSDEARHFLGDPDHPDAAPCERVGPLSPRYYTNAVGVWFGSITAQANPGRIQTGGAALQPQESSP